MHTLFQVSKLQHPYIVPHIASWITHGHTVNIVSAAAVVVVVVVVPVAPKAPKAVAPKAESNRRAQLAICSSGGGHPRQLLSACTCSLQPGQEQQPGQLRR